MGMKGRFLFVAFSALCAVLGGCIHEPIGDATGKEVKFSASTRSSNITKTLYSGYKYTSENLERIDWEDGDLIRVISNEVSAPADKYADYSITLKENSNQFSYATATPSGADHGLIWGEGTHTFFAMYPAPSTSGAQSGLDLSIVGDNGVVTAVLPEDQSFGTARVSKDEDYYGDMRLEYMSAWAQAASGSDVTLSFTPIVTTFYVTVTNSTGNAMTLRRITLSSEGSALTGTYKATITPSGVRSYSFFQGGSWVSAPSRTLDNSTVYCSFATGLNIPDDDAVTVALFAFPQNITQLTLSVTSDETGTVSLPMKYSDQTTWINFTGGNKHNLNNLGVPPVTYNLTVDKTLLSYDQSGVAASAQEFTVTSTKTIGSNVKPAGWKTQIKVGDDFVDMTASNRPAWMSVSGHEFPLNSSGITTNSQAYMKNVGEQPVVSHEDMLKSNKVYDSSGAVYDNSSQANALDLSKYNFINRRQESMRTTANTYIVASPGWYKIPMVYGNLIENGSTVDKACKGSTWALGHLDYFKKATDANIYLGINYPWLQSSYLDHCGIHWEKYTHWTGSASITTGRQWSSGSDIGVVTDVTLEKTEEFIYFRVDPDMIRPGNVLLATYDSDGDCCWSWQIWITDQKMNLITVGTNQVLPVNLGWVDDTEGQHYPARSAVLKFVSTEIDGLETDEMTVEQPELDRVSTSGWQTYYQWGRKDPMSVDVMNVYNDDGTLNKSIKHPSNIMYDESTSGSDEYYDWTSANYNNLWDSQNNSWNTSTADLPNHKTVYDPSPRGFSVPPDAAWDGFETWGAEKFENGQFYYTSSGRTSTIFFPASGYINYNATVVSDNGAGGYYWTSHPGENVQRRASFCLRFQRDGLGVVHEVFKNHDATSPFTTMAYRALAYSVRPVQYNVSASDSDVITGSQSVEIVVADQAAGWGWTSDTNLKSGVTKSSGDVSIYVKGNNTLSTNDPKYIASDNTITLGNDNELTVSVPAGHQIISISISFTSDDGTLVLGIPSLADITAVSSPNNGGGFTDGNGRKDKNANWNIESYTGGVFTPSANSVKFSTSTSGGSRRISSIYVVYK